MPEGSPVDRRFEDFYVFEYARLVGALCLVTGDIEGARDAVDEACARACERLARGRPIDVLGAWIRVVAVNAARDRLRRRRSERIALRRLAQRPSDDVAELSAGAAAAADVRAALARLPRQQREVVVWFYFLDQSVETIAAELRVPAGTVKSALHRARVALAERLAGDSDREGRTVHG